MDEHRDPQTNAPDEGELLAAYLDADTDDITSARVERLLRQDPQAAARLDALARARVGLQRLDDVEPPEGFRERLQARLAAEHAEHAAHEQSAGEPSAGDATATPVVERPARRWFAPLTAAAALVLVAVIGASALLGQTGGGDDSAATSADTQAESRKAAEAPLAQDEAGGGDAAEAEPDEPAEAGGEESAAAQAAPGSGGAASDGSSGRDITRLSGDANLSQHLRRLARASEEPYSREFEARERSGLPTAPMCVSGIDEAAADLVEFNERLVVAALINGDDGSRVVLYDARSCDRIRTFAAE